MLTCVYFSSFTPKIFFTIRLKMGLVIRRGRLCCERPVYYKASNDIYDAHFCVTFHAARCVRLKKVTRGEKQPQKKITQSNICVQGLVSFQVKLIGFNSVF